MGTARLGGAGLLAAAVAATAIAQEPDKKRGNLDRDAALEEVRVVDEAPNVPVSDIERYRIRIADTCPDGSSVDRPVSGLGTEVAVLELTPADTRKGQEVFFVLDASGRGGWSDSRLVAWREGDAPCRRPRALFRYPPAGDRPKPPRGGDFRADWEVGLGNYSSRHRGKEVLLEEWYTDENDSISKPTILRRTFYRYNARRDRHTAYHRIVKRNQQY